MRLSNWAFVLLSLAAAGTPVVLAGFQGAPEQDQTLYLVTEQDGHWGIRARSSFAP